MHSEAKRWLTVRPAPSWGIEIPPSAFLLRLRFHLALRLCADEERCPRCFARPFLDPYGIHLLVCKSRLTPCLGGSSIRHNRILFIIRSLLRSAGRAPELEVTAQHYLDRLHSLASVTRIRLPNHLADRKPDVIAEDEHGGVDILDVTVLSTRIEELKAYAKKLGKYTPLLPFFLPGNKVVPLVFEVNGAIHPETLAFLKRTGAAAAAPESICASQGLQLLLQRVAAALTVSLSAALSAGRDFNPFLSGDLAAATVESHDDANHERDAALALHPISQDSSITVERPIGSTTETNARAAFMYHASRAAYPHQASVTPLPSRPAPPSPPSASSLDDEALLRFLQATVDAMETARARGLQAQTAHVDDDPSPRSVAH